MVALGLIACVLFAYALLSRRVEGTVVTGPMVFVAAGLICGWTELAEFGSAAGGGDDGAARQVVVLVAELALVLLLFTDAARVDPRALRGNPLPARLLGIGLPLTVALGALLGLLVLTDLEPWECAIRRGPGADGRRARPGCRLEPRGSRARPPGAERRERAQRRRLCSVPDAVHRARGVRGGP